MGLVLTQPLDSRVRVVVGQTVSSRACAMMSVLLAAVLCVAAAEAKMSCNWTAPSGAVYNLGGSRDQLARYGSLRCELGVT